MLIRVLALLLLTAWSAGAEVLVYRPSGVPRGRILVVHPQGRSWAEKLQTLGYHCVWVSGEPTSLPQDVATGGRELGDFVVLGEGDSASGALSCLELAPGARACALIEPRGDVQLSATPKKPQLVVAARAPICSGERAWFERSRLEIQLLSGGVEGMLQDNHPVQKSIRQFACAHTGPAPAGLAGVAFVASPNWSVRSVGETIDTVVVHATVINTMEGTQRAFLDDRVRRVSAHYIVDRDGTIVQMVDERLSAWHAGVSELEGKTGVNDFSIGVELINLNDGLDPYPEAQVQALVRIIRDLRTRWNIPRSRIVSHAQIARPVGRKSDPLGFDFEQLFRMLGD